MIVSVSVHQSIKEHPYNQTNIQHETSVLSH